MREVLASYLGRILSPNFWATMILTWSAELIRSSNKGINSLPKDNWSLSLVLQITAGNSKTQEQWWVLISPWCAHSRSSKKQRKRSDGKIYYLEWKIVKILLLITLTKSAKASLYWFSLHILSPKNGTSLVFAIQT